MSYTSTTNLSLRKDNGDEKIVDMRPHLNTNLDVIDQAYGELDGRCRGQQTWGNLKSTSTWGELKGNGVTTPSSQTTNLELIKPGYDSNVDVEVFNDNMDAIDSAIGPLPSNQTLQGQISTLRDSVKHITISKTASATTGTMTYSGASFTIPANHTYAIHVRQNWGSGRPAELLLCTSSTSTSDTYKLAKETAGGTCNSIFYAGYTTSDLTVYVWGSLSNDGVLSIIVNGTIIADV